MRVYPPPAKADPAREAEEDTADMTRPCVMKSPFAHSRILLRPAIACRTSDDTSEGDNA